MLFFTIQGLVLGDHNLQSFYSETLQNVDYEESHRVLLLSFFNASPFYLLCDWSLWDVCLASFVSPSLVPEDGH